MRGLWKLPDLWTRKRPRAHKVLGRRQTDAGAHSYHRPRRRRSTTSTPTTALPRSPSIGDTHRHPLGVAGFQPFPPGRFSTFGDTQTRAVMLGPALRGEGVAEVRVRPTGPVCADGLWKAVDDFEADSRKAPSTASHEPLENRTRRAVFHSVHKADEFIGIQASRTTGETPPVVRWKCLRYRGRFFCQLQPVVSPPFRERLLRPGVDLRRGRGTEAMTLRSNVLTDSEVGKTSATSGASTTATVSFSRAAYGFGFALDQSSWYSAGMSTSLVRRRDLRVFFIFATLAHRDLSGADITDPVVRLRKDYQKEAPPCRMTEDERAYLMLAVGRIGQHLGQRIAKDSRGFLEGHPVLPEVGRSFGGIPRELGARPSTGQRIIPGLQRVDSRVGLTLRMSCDRALAVGLAPARQLHPLVRPPAHLPRQILQASSKPGSDCCPRLLDPAQELRVVLEPVLEPVILGFETDQNTRRTPMTGDQNLLFCC